MVGRTISHYRIVGTLGTGGMGVVYSAEDVRLGRGVALKFVSEDLASDPAAVQRLRSEARAASALNHPNICTIYDIDEDAGHPFIVMELMKGRSLRERLAAGPLRVHEIVNLGIEVADALDAAHDHGIVHRDIKPANLFVTERGAVKVLDFGLAKVTTRSPEASTTVEDRTAQGLTLGTVSYMSPEQASGEVLDARTDLFSLGVVLYEAATGRHPFVGKTTGVVLAAILSRAQVAPATYNPDLPLRLQEVINNCLEKDRELRYQSAADLRADLRRVKRDLESGQSRAFVAVDSSGPLTWTGAAETQSAATAARPWPAAARSRRAPLLVALAVFAALGGGYVAWRSGPWLAGPPSASPPAVSADDPAVARRLDAAERSLADGHPRSALARADEVLAAVPGHVRGGEISEAARLALDKAETELAEARRRIGRKDFAGAVASLQAARAIDPESPAVAELSLQLAHAAGATASADDVQLPAREPVREGTGPSAPATRGPQPRVSPVAGQQVATSGRAPAAQEARAATAPPRADAAPEQAPTATTAPLVAASSSTTSSVLVVAPVVPGAPPLPPLQPTPAAPSPAGGTNAGATAPPVRERPRDASESPVAQDADERAIRAVTASYARAIETKDLALFRSVKPNLSASEEKRLRDGFKAVPSQRVSLTVLAIDRRADRALVQVRRRDTIDVGGREETIERGQTLTLARAGGGWVIVEIR